MEDELRLLQEPLKWYYCDVCKELMLMNDALIVYFFEDLGHCKVLKSTYLCHDKGICKDKVAKVYKELQDTGTISVRFDPLLGYTGSSGLKKLLHFLQNYKIPHNENLAETFRRLTIEYYEEARTYFDKFKEHGYSIDVSELSALDSNRLKKIITRFKEELDLLDY